MPITYARKPGELKIQNKEIVSWLMNEFGMSAGDAGYWAFSSTSEQKELIRMLREELPEAPFKTLNKLLREVPSDTLRKNLEILEEYDVPPSQLIPFLSEKTQDLEESIIKSIRRRSRKHQKNPVKKILEHIKKSAGVESINSETIGKVREELSNWTIRNPKRAEAMEISQKHFYVVQKVLRENPSYLAKRLLHEIYSFEEKEITMNELLERAGASKTTNIIIFPIMDELGLIERSPALYIGFGYDFYREPMNITWRNKEEMKKIWPSIEEWGKSIKPPVGIKSGRIKTRKKRGELLNETLAILGKKSVKELTEADEENIKNLARIDLKLRGIEVGRGAVVQERKLLLKHVALNESMEEKMLPISDRNKQEILQYIDEHPERVLKVPDERFGEIKVVRLPRNFYKDLGETKEKFPTLSYTLKALEKEGKHMFLHEGVVGSYTTNRSPITESQAKVLNACFDPDTGGYIRLRTTEIAAKTGMKPSTILSSILSLEIRGYIFKNKEEPELDRKQ